jgi:hypothetical protein
MWCYVFAGFIFISQLDKIFENNPPKIIDWFILLILVSWGVLLARWGIKKIKSRRKKNGRL